MLVAFWMLSGLFFPGPARSSSPEQPVEIAPGVFVIQAAAGPISAENAGRTANIAFVSGPKGVLVWNTGVSHRHGQQLLGQILNTVDKPIRVAVISHAYQDVLFGWSAFAQIDIPVWMHAGGVALMKRRCPGCLHQLTETLGPEEMFGTRLAEPDEILTGSRITELIGRKISLIDAGMSSGPNDLMLFDHESGVLFGGATVMTDQLVEIRDGRLAGWKHALTELGNLPVKTVVPDYGNPDTTEAIARTSAYLSDLEAAVTQLLKKGVTLADAVDSAPLPAYAHWAHYEDRHGKNIHQLYLRLESRFFD